jgi:transposase
MSSMPRIKRVKQFFELFPNEDACLAYIMRVRYGGTRLACKKCGCRRNFFKLTKRPAYSCTGCARHIYPMRGTLFARSRIPLHKWFYAMYLLTVSEECISAKELQRQLGVTYKSAWRMKREIRGFMNISDKPMATS